MSPDPQLVAFWIRFPGEPELRHSYGVTAHSLDDALALLKNHHLVGVDVEWPIGISANVRVEDLDQRHVVPNCGPMGFRGVWYPFDPDNEPS